MKIIKFKNKNYILKFDPIQCVWICQIPEKYLIHYDDDFKYSEEQQEILNDSTDYRDMKIVHLDLTIYLLQIIEKQNIIGQQYEIDSIFIENTRNYARIYCYAEIQALLQESYTFCSLTLVDKIFFTTNLNMKFKLQMKNNNNIIKYLYIWCQVCIESKSTEILWQSIDNIDDSIRNQMSLFKSTHKGNYLFQSDNFIKLFPSRTERILYLLCIKHCTIISLLWKFKNHSLYDVNLNKLIIDFL